MTQSILEQLAAAGAATIPQRKRAAADDQRLPALAVIAGRTERGAGAARHHQRLAQATTEPGAASRGGDGRASSRKGDSKGEAETREAVIRQAVSNGKGYSYHRMKTPVRETPNRHGDALNCNGLNRPHN